MNHHLFISVSKRLVALVVHISGVCPKYNMFFSALETLKSTCTISLALPATHHLFLIYEIQCINNLIGMRDWDIQVSCGTTIHYSPLPQQRCSACHPQSNGGRRKSSTVSQRAPSQLLSVHAEMKNHIIITIVLIEMFINDE